MMKSVNDLFLINCIKCLKVFPKEMDPLPRALENRLSDGITKISDCFLLQQHVWKAPHVLEEVEKLSSPEDKIFFELDHNELCMLDYLLPHKSNNSKKEASKALAYGIHLTVWQECLNHSVFSGLFILSAMTGHLS